MISSNFLILTGPPGSGKTTTLVHLARDQRVVAEPARGILTQARAAGEDGSGERDPDLFIARMRKCAEADYRSAAAHAPVFFDRGLPDLIAFQRYYKQHDPSLRLSLQAYRYNTQVYFFPSWRKIYVQDAERQLDFEGARRFGQLLWNGYRRLGYQCIIVPRRPPDRRRDFILETTTKLRRRRLGYAGGE